MTKKRSALVWQVSGGTAVGSSYLFGTMHVKDARAFGRREIVYEKILECDLFGTEIDLDEAPSFDPSTFQLPPGQSLDRLIPEKKYDRLKRILRKAFGLHLDQLRFLKPIVIANLIDEQILQNEMPEALDRHLWNYAAELGKTCLGIETVSEQIELLRNMPLEQQVKSLLSIGRNVSAQRKRVRTLTRAYERGDIFRIFQMARRGSGQFRHSMIFNRNRHMADRLSELMQRHTLFFAVGAGHLAGEQGLIRLLKQRGFRVRPVA
jgi:uncharacterized protein YbaP (TraB family)